MEEFLHLIRLSFQGLAREVEEFLHWPSRLSGLVCVQPPEFLAA